MRWLLSLPVLVGAWCADITFFRGRWSGEAVMTAQNLAAHINRQVYYFLHHLGM
jgi:hypothetical protein